MTARGWQRDGLILRYVGDLDADHGLDRDWHPEAGQRSWRHGTQYGYRMHGQIGSPACDACKAAKAAGERARVARKLKQRAMVKAS